MLNVCCSTCSTPQLFPVTLVTTKVHKNMNFCYFTFTNIETSKSELVTSHTRISFLESKHVQQQKQEVTFKNMDTNQVG